MIAGFPRFTVRLPFVIYSFLLDSFSINVQFFLQILIMQTRCHTRVFAFRQNNTAKTGRRVTHTFRLFLFPLRLGTRILSKNQNHT